MRRLSTLVVALAACAGNGGMEASPDAAITADASIDAAGDDAATSFYTASGMCGVLTPATLTSASPSLVQSKLTFARRFNDPADRPLLSTGGQKLAATPNAGGSSGFSEIFAYEQLQLCETASLLKTETEIEYDIDGKITDLAVTIDGETIGVSVTRAQTYPLGTPYSLSTAQQLLNKKLGDIKLSSMNVSEADRWRKQVLAVLAWDAQAASVMEEAWTGLDPSTKADTIVVVTTTDGDDVFIYTNM